MYTDAHVDLMDCLTSSEQYLSIILWR